MIQLKNSLKAWNTTEFNRVFKLDVEKLGPEILPIQQALQFGSLALLDNFQLMIVNTSENTEQLIIEAGVFFSSLIAGCNCSDDQTPAELTNEYCEMRFTINKSNAETTIKIINQ